jgi:hypothetical protein
MPYADTMPLVLLLCLVLLCPSHSLVADHPECNSQPHGASAQSDQIGGVVTFDTVMTHKFASRFLYTVLVEHSAIEEVEYVPRYNR